MYFWTKFNFFEKIFIVFFRVFRIFRIFFCIRISFFSFLLSLIKIKHQIIPFYLSFMVVENTPQFFWKSKKPIFFSSAGSTMMQIEFENMSFQVARVLAIGAIATFRLKKYWFLRKLQPKNKTMENTPQLTILPILFTNSIRKWLPWWHHGFMWKNDFTYI